MSSSNQNFIAANSEFIALCQSQVALLTQGLGATWTVVYLTEGLLDNSPKKLVPVLIYPQTSSNLVEYDTNFNIIAENWDQVTDSPRLLASSFDLNLEVPDTQTTETPKSVRQKHQIVLPLIYEKMIMGVLVTGRKDRDWNSKELSQIEKIAHTLAIARLLDQRQEWYQKQQRLQRDRLDDLLHQLRNPLTALRTFSKLLLKRLFPEDKNYSVAEGMLRESDRLKELLQQFDLEIDQMETQVVSPLILGTNSLSLPPSSNSSLFLLPGKSLDLKLIDLQDILPPLINSSKAIAAEKNIELTSELSLDLPSVLANTQALTEVFSNLLDNAIKYTPEGGKIIIHSLGKNDSNYQGIAISDTGYGIPMEDQNNLFQRHYRGVQGEGNIPGTGLGLAIVKELLEQMEGKIEVISPNSSNPITANIFSDANYLGSTFVVWLKI